MPWIIKTEDGAYLTESAPGTAYYHEKQKFAKRFYDQGLAYRIARKWGADDNRVVKLIPKKGKKKG